MSIVLIVTIIWSSIILLLFSWLWSRTRSVQRKFQAYDIAYNSHTQPSRHPSRKYWYQTPKEEKKKLQQRHTLIIRSFVAKGYICGFVAYHTAQISGVSQSHTHAEPSRHSRRKIVTSDPHRRQNKLQQRHTLVMLHSFAVDTPEVDMPITRRTVKTLGLQQQQLLLYIRVMYYLLLLWYTTTVVV